MEAMTPKPTPLAPNFDAIPQQMKDAPRWCVWKYEYREKSDDWSKPPYQTNGRYASSTNSNTWCSFEQAKLAYTSDGGWDGIGFFLGDGWIGVDFDTVEDHAEDLHKLNGYAEKSPSGMGKLHVLARAKLKTLDGKKTNDLEIYANARYFTVTGHAINGFNQIPDEDRTGEFAAFYREKFNIKPPPPPPDDDDLCRRVARSEPKLWDGDTSDHGGDHSAADFALVGCIYRLCGAEHVDTVFRRSGLMRPKWDTKRGAKTYGEQTIDRVIASTRSAPGTKKATKAKPAVSAGDFVLSTTHTMPTAELFMRDQYPDNTLVAHNGVIYVWDKSRYVEMPIDALRHHLQKWLVNCLEETAKGEGRPFPCNPSTIDDALKTVRIYRTVLAGDTQPPAWIDGADGPEPREILFGKTEMVHLPTGTVLPNSPRMFNLNALPVDFDPAAPEPRRWLGFLASLKIDDEQIAALQQWFGYCLTADTSQQKAMLIIGPKRSGKGTIARVLRQLVGEKNCAGPTTSSLAGMFGLQPLLGKTLAIIADARFHGDGVQVVTERLLNITGEDPITVDRKHLESVETKLLTRFLCLSNDLPKFSDASGALPGRFIMLRLHRTFYGREDTKLENTLRAELPGILAWAVAGWTMLQEQGRFIEPASTRDVVEELEDLASPVSSFLKDRCIIGPNEWTYTDTLYAAWVVWCKSEGRHPTQKAVFSKDLRSVLPHVAIRRDAKQNKFYEGVSLALTV
jgi:putative DNA primase/helicase